MAEDFGLTSGSMRPKRGRRPYFTPEGKVALMFLKMYTDATCYESEMRYPTDAKLLWEGIEKSHGIMCELSRRPRQLPEMGICTRRCASVRNCALVAMAIRKKTAENDRDEIQKIKIDESEAEARCDKSLLRSN